MSEEIIHLLTKEYTLILATTEEDLQAVKKLRGDVFSSKLKVPLALLETQKFLLNEDDKQSFIYLLRHNHTGRYVGTVRILFVNKHTVEQTLSMQKDSHVENIEHFTQNQPIGEISRMGLSSSLPAYQDFSALKLSSYLSLALMIAIRINSFIYHYNTLFSLIEPSLHRILKRQRANFEQIGEPVEYYGMRTPYAIGREKLLQETEENVGQVTRYYLKELCKNPEKFWQFIDNNPYLERSDIQLDRICQLFKEHGNDVDLALLLGDDIGKEKESLFSTV